MAANMSDSAATLPITFFPIEQYDQHVNTWLPPTAANYHQSLLSTKLQKLRMQELYRHVFATGKNAASPWDGNFIQSILKQQPGLVEFESLVIDEFNNSNKDAAHISYGENFRAYPPEWIRKIADNMQLDGLKQALEFSEDRRAIMTQNSSVRALPTNDVNFYSYQIAGQGYPFDNLQVSMLWAGTPVYIFAYSKDQRWALVASPAESGWVEANTLAKVNRRFISRWQKAAKKNLVAITAIDTPVLNRRSKSYQFSMYMGAMLPLIKMEDSYYRVWFPFRNSDGQAEIQEGLIERQSAELMPLAATPVNFAKLITHLQNRPYGWGNLYSYNDCSAELKSLFLPFGIWLPRNSSDQAFVGRTYDAAAAAPAERIHQLVTKGHPLMTIAYIGGHIFLYVGHFPQANKNHAPADEGVMTYQNIWGMGPADNSRRAIIGQSLFIPLLLSYPQDPALQSLAAKHYFIISNLDEMPAVPYDTSQRFFGDLKEKIAAKKNDPNASKSSVIHGVSLDRQ